MPWRTAMIRGGAMLMGFLAPGLVLMASAAARDDQTKETPKPAGGTGSSLTAKEADGVVQYHNKVRKDVGVPPVKWSPTVAKFAQQWADELARTGNFEHRPRQGQWAQKYGENIAVGFGGGYDTLSGCQNWYSEIKFYTPGTPIPRDFANFKA